MTTSELLQHGIDSLRPMLPLVESWMEEPRYESIGQMQGSMSRQNVASPAVFHPANYMKVLSTYALSEMPSSTMRSQ